MPDQSGPPSEFGGKVQPNRVQPLVAPNGRPGHIPTPSEELMLTYTTGDPTGVTTVPDGGEAFAGLLPVALAEQILPEPEPFTDF